MYKDLHGLLHYVLNEKKNNNKKPQQLYSPGPLTHKTYVQALFLSTENMYACFIAICLKLQTQLTNNCLQGTNQSSV